MRGSDADTWDDVVGDLYDAVLQKESEPLYAAIRRFEREIDSDGCHLFGLGQGRQELFTVVTYPNEVSAETEPYYGYYIHADPRIGLASQSVGKVVRASDHFSPSYISRSEFFQDYLIPLGRQFTTGGVLFQTGSSSGMVAFNRFKGRPDFDDAELASVRRYFPHLQRAVRMAYNDSMANLLHGTQADLLQQQAVGVIGLNRHHQVIFINPAARKLLAPLPDLGLQGAALRGDSPLALACQQAHRNRKPQPMRLHTPEGELVVTAWATPKRNTSNWLPSIRAASDQVLHTCVLVQLLRPGHRLTPSLLMQLYGFTPAEARLAKELVQGSTAEAYAQTYHVSMATVRTQLRNVLAKTSYARQQDLIAHLATLQVL